MSSRRAFIKGSGLAMFGIGLGGMPAFLAAAVASNKKDRLYKKNKTLVFIFQRGAMDGLMAVAPFTDPFLKAARPGLFMDALSKDKNSLIDLDGRFGLHPSMDALAPLFLEKRLAVVHGMGSPNNTRSHFDAQDYMESGTPFNKGTTSGWLNRAIGLSGHEATPFRAVSITSSTPRSFYGDNDVVSVRNLNDLSIRANGNVAGNQFSSRSFEELYDQTTAELLNKTGKESFEVMKMLQKNNAQSYAPANGAVYPNSPLGNSLKQIAHLIKMDVGLEVAFAESGGWDTHFNQGKESGTFARNASDLSKSIAAFWKDIESYQDDVTLMTSTEFGRTVKQNGTGGTDHGRASCTFVLGNDINGGMVHGKVQPLAVENLADGRDLAVTTDFRSVFYEVATKHLNIQQTNLLFPDWAINTIGLAK